MNTGDFFSKSAREDCWTECHNAQSRYSVNAVGFSSGYR